jgi:hypothetical protein
MTCPWALGAEVAVMLRPKKRRTGGVAARVVRRRSLLIDLAIISLFGCLHTAAWIEVDTAAEVRDIAQSAQRIRETATGGISVVGILIPLTIIAIQIRGSTPLDDRRGHLIRPALADLLVANFWLLASLILGLYVLYFSVFNGYRENLLTHKHVGPVHLDDERRPGPAGAGGEHRWSDRAVAVLGRLVPDSTLALSAEGLHWLMRRAEPGDVVRPLGLSS